MPSPSKKELPQFVRRCYDEARKATEQPREAEKLRLKFYVGGDLQWLDQELTKRRNQGRPWVTINKCKPAVDQIEGDIRLNPPGPQCHPVGDGADSDVADIFEGLIREAEHRCQCKQTAYPITGKYSAASGVAYLELATEYASDRTLEQRLVISAVEDPGCVFFDPVARAANRQDAGWAGKVKMYTRSQYVAQFGNRRAVLDKNLWRNFGGWIQDAVGVRGSLSQIIEWTGNSEGPFYVCEFYYVDIEDRTLRMYTDGICRFDGEEVPRGEKPRPGDENVRKAPKRTIHKYVVDALEVLDETTWPGKLIPIFPVLGPEVYIEGKLYRLSLISDAIDSNRALNYAASTSMELVGNMPRAPYLGWKGQFDDPRWQTANSEQWAFLEITPVFATDPVTNESTLLPAPQRNLFETVVQQMIPLGQWFSDNIKAVTGIYDPSLGATKGDQSGVAIEQLRSESNVGTFSYPDNLHRALGVMYGEMIYILPQITDQNQVVTVVRADSQHEIKVINQIFEKGVDPKTGQPGKALNLSQGLYAVRCVAAKSFEDRKAEALAYLTDFFKMAPQALAIPGVMSRMLRLVDPGNPKLDEIADLLDPQAAQGQDPQKLAQQNAALLQMVQQLKQAIATKEPELQAKRFSDVLKAVTSIEVAKINASKDTDTQAADILAAQLEQRLDMAHEAAMQGVDHAHEQAMGQQQAQTASAQSAQDAAQSAENEPAEATQ